MPIKVLFICHGRMRIFSENGLKSRLSGCGEVFCTPIVPYFEL